MENLIVGIDLGTTYSSIAYVDEAGRPEVIRNAFGSKSTPSVVSIGDDGRIVVGEEALNEWVINEEHVVRWIKRRIGDPAYKFQGLSAVEISAEILKTLKEDAERALGQPVEDAVITCPAYFASIEIENTKRAGELAGLRVKEVVKEPTAAAVYWGIDHMREGEKILVCDLGGGTYDATILGLRNNEFTPLASTGDRRLGGHDWTMELVEMAAEAFSPLFGEDPLNDLAARQHLYQECEKAKRDFSRLAQVSIPCPLRGKLEHINVARSDFEERTEYKISQLVLWCTEALKKCNPPLNWPELSNVLLVGGSSRLRRMALALKDASGKDPVQTGDPDYLVALGAAILARGKVRRRAPVSNLVEARRSNLVEVQFKRTIARSLGTRVVVHESGQPRIANSLLIPHGTSSPVSRCREDYSISANGQAFFDVPVVEFEDDDNFDVVGNYRFACPRGVRKGTGIRIAFSYDLSGIVSVEATESAAGQLLPGERLDYEEPDVSAEAFRPVRPRWVIFAVDTSGSMGGVKMEAARMAVVENARLLLGGAGDGCRVAIVSFSATAQVVCPITSSMRAIEEAAGRLVPASTTAMDAGIRESLRIARSAPPGTDCDVVMLTDGMPDKERRSQTLEAADECRAVGVNLSNLGVGKNDVDLEFLAQLSPTSLVVDSADKISEAFGFLLTQSSSQQGAQPGLAQSQMARAGGLTDVH
jgi:molecular chaperone DnaK (HSP70)/uncharacterized protein YegL